MSEGCKRGEMGVRGGREGCERGVRGVVRGV